MSKVRLPFVPPTRQVASPDDPEVVFTIKRAGNAEHLARENMNSKVRYFESQEEGGQVVSEREFPFGAMKLETVMLCLTAWNIEEAPGAVAPITKENVIRLLSPEEFNFLYEQVMEFNPLWQRGGEKNSEKDSGKAS